MTYINTKIMLHHQSEVRIGKTITERLLTGDFIVAKDKDGSIENPDKDLLALYNKANTFFPNTTYNTSGEKHSKLEAIKDYVQVILNELSDEALHKLNLILIDFEFFYMREQAFRTSTIAVPFVRAEVEKHQENPKATERYLIPLVKKVKENLLKYDTEKMKKDEIQCLGKFLDFNLKINGGAYQTLMNINNIELGSEPQDSVTTTTISAQDRRQSLALEYRKSISLANTQAFQVLIDEILFSLNNISNLERPLILKLNLNDPIDNIISLLTFENEEDLDNQTIRNSMKHCPFLGIDLQKLKNRCQEIEISCQLFSSIDFGNHKYSDDEIMYLKNIIYTVIMMKNKLAVNSITNKNPAVSLSNEEQLKILTNNYDALCKELCNVMLLNPLTLKDTHWQLIHDFFKFKKATFAEEKDEILARLKNSTKDLLHILSNIKNLNTCLFEKDEILRFIKDKPASDASKTTRTQTISNKLFKSSGKEQEILKRSFSVASAQRINAPVIQQPTSLDANTHLSTAETKKRASIIASESDIQTQIAEELSRRRKTIQIPKDFRLPSLSQPAIPATTAIKPVKGSNAQQDSLLQEMTSFQQKRKESITLNTALDKAASPAPVKPSAIKEVNPYELKNRERSQSTVTSVQYSKQTLFSQQSQRSSTHLPKQTPATTVASLGKQLEGKLKLQLPQQNSVSNEESTPVLNRK